MEARKKFQWKVTLEGRRSRELYETTFENYWSPTYEGILGEVGVTAAAEAWHKSGKAEEFVPISVKLIDEEVSA